MAMGTATVVRMRVRMTTDRSSGWDRSVRQWSSDVVLFSYAETLTAEQREQLVARHIGAIEGLVARIAVANDTVRGASSKTGGRFPARPVLMRPRFISCGLAHALCRRPRRARRGSTCAGWTLPSWTTTCLRTC